MKKLLLVTFPVDLGNTTYEKRFVSLFQGHPELDLKVFRFAPSPRNPHPNSIFTFDYVVLFLARLLESIRLQKAIREAHREGRKVLFHGVSTALFGYFATGQNRSYVVTDWTRKLYEPIWKSSGSPGWLTRIHREVLNAQRSVLGLTDAVVEQIAKDYAVPHSKLKKVKLPFCRDLELFSANNNFQDKEVRILFVGGDFQRKGGDVLLAWFKQHCNAELKMTMVTGASVETVPGVTIERNVQYGQPKHIELFKNHDVFVLPTNCDGYPSVLGEAACAGLAILTTKNALGASEIIQSGKNGYICESQMELLDKLTTLIKNKSLIVTMKQNSRKLMEENFSFSRVLNEYLQHIFE
jgi:glycosyltransferase involved in cell wall biosynthesis